jgi:uncharacterized protein (DUF1501 family)
MSRIHFQKRRDFVKGAACFAASGAASTFVPQLSMMGTALAGAAPTGYKALVCIYLDGGNDSWNLLIPSDNSTQIPVSGRTPLSGFSPTPYGWYVTSRGGQFQGSPSALGLLPPGSDPGAPFLPPSVALNGGQYAVNPATPELATLYNSGRLAFIANVGPLVQPLKRGNFNSFPRPPQLYSHNDQTSLWTIGGGAASNDPAGWGGRLMGNLLGSPPSSGLSPCISIAGQTKFLVGEYPGGQTVFPYRLSNSATTPATALNNYNTGNPAGAKRREVLDALVASTYPQAFTSEYGDILERSLGLSSTVNTAIAGLGTNAAFNAFVTAVNAIPNSGLGQQLRQVARMIAVSRFGQGTIQANRQVFFVRTGGYDTHDGQIPAARPNNGVWAGHQGLLQQVAQAMNGFYNAMTALNAVSGFTGVVNEVLTFTMSEFSRTINSNGNGTDHAWGAVNMVMGASSTTGGPLNGGQVYGRYPLQLLNRRFTNDTPDNLGECFNRGEFLPSTAVDQFAATLSRWMGVSNVDLPVIYPNIDAVTSAGHPNAAVMAYNNRVIPNMISGIS